MFREERLTKKLHNKEARELDAVGATYSWKARKAPPRAVQAAQQKSAFSEKKAEKKKTEEKKKEGVKELGGSGPATGTTAVTLSQDGDTAFLTSIERLMAAKSGLAGAPTGESSLVQVGSQMRPDLNLGLPWVNTVFNGVAEGDCRFPDPFTLMKTSVTQVVTCGQWSMQALAPGTPGANDYGEFGILFGSGHGTLAHFSSIDTSTSSWNTSTTGSLVAINGGVNNIDLMSRPVGIVLTLKPQMIGPAHSVYVCAFPINPWSFLAIQEWPVFDTGWPRTATDIRKTITAQQSLWGGRFWEFKEGDDAIKLVTLPIDSRCMDFTISNYERTPMYLGPIDYAGLMAWTGWVFWVFGATQADKLTYKLNVVEETLFRTVEATVFPYPQSLRKSNSGVRDSLINTAAQAVQSGLNGIKLGDKIMDAVKGVGSGLLKKLTSMGSALLPEIMGASGGFSNMAPPANLPDSFFEKSALARKALSQRNGHVKQLKRQPEEEKKLDALPLGMLSEATRAVNALSDDPEIVTPRNARRPSLTLSVGGRRK